MVGLNLRRIIIAVIIVGAIFSLMVLFGFFHSSSVAPQAKQELSDADMQQLIVKGRELTLAGDCLGCHSQANGPKAAGGVPINTPFGTVYSTNISPDKTHGIGNYSREDFHRVLRDGIAPNNRNLFPAMPYIFTQITTADDIDAIYAYLMSLEPMNVPNKKNTGAFALPVRPFLNFWNLLNFPRRSAPAPADRSDLWIRGAYLTEGLAHCASCHTPFNFMMGTDFARNLQGSVIDGIETPDITPQALARLGYDVPTLSRYLQTGMAPQGTSFASMNTVTHFSTSVMNDDDIKAIATYLLTNANGQIEPPAALTKPGSLPADTDNIALNAGHQVYLNACAGCHGVTGKGIPNVSPALAGNAIIAMSSAKDTIEVILQGIPTQKFTGDQLMYAMPPFAHSLQDDEIAAMVNWMRLNWGGQSADVKPADVSKLAANLSVVRSQ